MKKVDEIAKELNFERHTIYKYIKNGKIKAVKFGKEYRVQDDEYKKIMENGIMLNKK